MNIIVIMKLLDINLLYHIVPLSSSENIDTIYIVRDFPGPSINKVIYVCPPPWIQKILPVAFVYKFLLVVKIAMTKNPKLIHGYLFFPHGLIGMIVGKIFNIKTSVSLIAGPIEIFAPGSSPTGQYCYTKKLPNFNLYNRIILKLLDKSSVIIVAGDYTRDFLIQSGIKEQKIVTIPYVVVNNDLGTHHYKKVYDLVYVGRLSKSKHVDIIIRLLNILNRDHGIEANLAIIGDGNCREDLINLSRDLKIEQKVIFLGFQKNIGYLLNLCKISIIASERETGPLTAIESLMCGLPVISSKCGDMVNGLIINGTNGYLIDDFDDIETYVNNLVDVLTNENLYLYLSRNASNTVNQEIEIIKATEMWDILLNNLQS